MGALRREVRAAAVGSGGPPRNSVPHATVQMGVQPCVTVREDAGACQLCSGDMLGGMQVLPMSGIHK